MAITFTVTRDDSPIASVAALGRPARRETRIPMRVLCSGLGAGPDDIRAQGPAYMTPLAAGSPELLHEKNITGQFVDDPLCWKMELVYRLAEPGLEPAPEDPTGRRWAVVVTCTSVTTEVPTQFALGDDFAIDADTGAVTGLVKILNTAGEDIDEITRLQNDEEWNFSFCADVPDWDGLDTAFGPDSRGSTNDADFTLSIRGSERTFKANSLRFAAHTVAWEPDPVTGVFYPRSTYKCFWRSGGWARRIANKGFHHLVGGVLKANLENDALPVSQDNLVLGNPVPLAADGSRAAVGSEMILLIFREYPRIDFDSFLRDLDT